MVPPTQQRPNLSSKCHDSTQSTSEAFLHQQDTEIQNGSKKENTATETQIFEKAYSSSIYTL
jgi:hypothetical protein